MECNDLLARLEAIKLTLRSNKTAQKPLLQTHSSLAGLRTVESERPVAKRISQPLDIEAMFQKAEDDAALANCRRQKALRHQIEKQRLNMFRAKERSEGSGKAEFSVRSTKEEQSLVQFYEQKIAQMESSFKSVVVQMTRQFEEQRQRLLMIIANRTDAIEELRIQVNQFQIQEEMAIAGNTVVVVRESQEH